MRRMRHIALLILVVATGCRNTATRSHETCVKEAAFAMQRAAEKVAHADDYESALAAVELLKVETGTLKRLCDEFNAFPPPSGWERSRMRRHRTVVESAGEKWTAAVATMQQRIEEGLFPPDVRQRLDEVLSGFDAARQRFCAKIEPFWD
jgi:hypothetical protein